MKSQKPSGQRGGGESKMAAKIERLRRVHFEKKKNACILASEVSFPCIFEQGI